MKTLSRNLTNTTVVSGSKYHLSIRTTLNCPVSARLDRFHFMTYINK